MIWCIQDLDIYVTAYDFGEPLGIIVHNSENTLWIDSFRQAK